MKSSFVKWGMIILIILLGMSLTCDVNDPADDLKIVVDTDPITTVISGSVVNGADSAPIDGVTVRLTVNGDDAAQVVNLNGAAQTDFELSEGIVSFALTEASIPSDNDPVELLLIARAAGYLSTSLPLKIYQTGSKTFRLYMIKIDDPPEGVAQEEGSGQADNAGTLLQDVDVEVTEPVTGAKSSVELPQGLMLYTEDGTPLQGNLNVLLVYNNNQSDASLASFPGGFDVTVDQNGTVTEGGLFVSAGLATVEISDAAGNVAHTFGYNAGAGKRLGRALTDEDTLPTIRVGVPSDTYNPETGGLVADGDEIDIWLYDVEGGVWEHSSRDSITDPDGRSDYSVKFTVDHLTPCNPDWWWFINTCWVDRMVYILGNDDLVPLMIRLKMADGSGYVWTAYNIIDEVHLQLRALVNTPYIIEAWTDCGEESQLVGSVTVNPLCGTTGIQLTVTIPDIETTEKTIQLSGYCECDDNLVVRPNSNTIWYQNTQCGAGSWIAIGSVVNGELTIEGLEIGVTYLFGTWYGGWYQIAATIYEDYSVYVPDLSTSDLIESVSVEGDVISYTVRLPEEVCAEFCPSTAD